METKTIDTQKDKELFLEILCRGEDLLELKEFDKFHFDVDLNEDNTKEFSEFIKKKIKTEAGQLLERSDRLAPKILEKTFTAAKKNEMLAIFKKIENKYSGDLNIKILANTSRIFLEDERANRCYLPLAIKKVVFDICGVIEKINSKLICDGWKLTDNNKFDEAEKVFINLKQDYLEYGSAAKHLAYFYYETGKEEKARDEINDALRAIYKSWQEAPHFLLYEDVEEIEQVADEILSRPEEAAISRFVNYIYGLLYDIGAVSFKEMFDYFKLYAKIKISSVMRGKSLMDAIVNDTRFKIKDNYIYLSVIEDIDSLLSERKKRRSKTHLGRTLGEIKLRQEGRFNELFSEEEKEINKELTDLTNNTWDIVKVREIIRLDITERAHTDKLMESMTQFLHCDEIVDLINDIWNITPRWELGGKSPDELSEFAAHENRSRYAPAPSTFIAKFPKTGRNEPCPCGSGKKYKKCCGA